MNREVAGYPLWGWGFFFLWMGGLWLHLGWSFWLNIGIRALVIFAVFGIAWVIGWIQEKRETPSKRDA